jgi:hypothetical protein
MHSVGVDVDLARRRGALAIVPGPEAPAAGEPFVDRALEWLGQLSERASGEGYSALRLAAEMTWALGRPSVSRRWPTTSRA